MPLRLRPLSHRSIIPLLALLLAGCSSEQVIVIDTFHHPIAGAAVSAQVGSTKDDPEFTDKAGHADVSLGPPWRRTKLVHVSKNGYAPVRTPVPETWPLIVRMSVLLPSREEVWIPMSQPTSRPVMPPTPGSGRGAFPPR